MPNLETIQAGDKVAYAYGRGRTFQFSTVKKVYKLRIKLENDLEFSRKSGYLTGRSFCGREGYLVDVEEAEQAQQAASLARAKRNAARELIATIEKRYTFAGAIHLTIEETEAIKALTEMLKANREEA